MGLSALELGKSWAHGDEMLPLQDSPSLIRSKGALERIRQIVVPLDWCHNPPSTSQQLTTASGLPIMTF